MCIVKHTVCGEQIGLEHVSRSSIYLYAFVSESKISNHRKKNFMLASSCRDFSVGLFKFIFCIPAWGRAWGVVVLPVCYGMVSVHVFLFLVSFCMWNGISFLWDIFRKIFRTSQTLNYMFLKETRIVRLVNCLIIGRNK